MTDDDYCTMCGSIPGDCCPGDVELLDAETALGRFETMCFDCVEGIGEMWQEHYREFGDLDYFDWFKLAYDSRVIVVDNVTYAELHAAASLMGLTIDQFVVQAVMAAAEQILEGESE